MSRSTFSFVSHIMHSHEDQHWDFRLREERWRHLCIYLSNFTELRSSTTRLRASLLTRAGAVR